MPGATREVRGRGRPLDLTTGRLRGWGRPAGLQAPAASRYAASASCPPPLCRKLRHLRGNGARAATRLAQGGLSRRFFRGPSALASCRRGGGKRRPNSLSQLRRRGWGILPHLLTDARERSGATNGFPYSRSPLAPSARRGAASEGSSYAAGAAVGGSEAWPRPLGRAAYPCARETEKAREREGGGVGGGVSPRACVRVRVCECLCVWRGPVSWSVSVASSPGRLCRRRRHEVRVQGGAPVREAPLGGGEDPKEVPGPGPGHCGKGAQGPDRRPGQEEIPCPIRPHSWAVLLPDPEKNPPPSRGRPLLLRQQRHPPNQRHHGAALPGTSRGGLLPVHCLQR